MVVSPSTGCCANVQTTEESGDCHPHESWVTTMFSPFGTGSTYLKITQYYIYIHMYMHI